MLLTMSSQLWQQIIHVLMANSSRIISYVIKLKSLKKSFLKGTVPSLYFNGLHSQQILDYKRAPLGCGRAGDTRQGSAGIKSVATTTTRPLLFALTHSHPKWELISKVYHWVKVGALCLLVEFPHTKIAHLCPKPKLIKRFWIPTFFKLLL